MSRSVRCCLTPLFLVQVTVQILLSFFIVEIRVYLQACNTRMNIREGVSNISSSVTSMVVSLTPLPPPPPVL